MSEQEIASAQPRKDGWRGYRDTALCVPAAGAVKSGTRPYTREGGGGRFSYAMPWTRSSPASRLTAMGGRAGTGLPLAKIF